MYFSLLRWFGVLVCQWYFLSVFFNSKEKYIFFLFGWFGSNLIRGTNEANFLQQQMTTETARGENQEIFRQTFHKNNQLDLMRESALAYFIRWQIKSGTMMDRIIPPSLKSNPNSPFSKCLSITNPTICSRSALQLYKSNLFNPFAGSRKYLNHPHIRNTNSWCSQILPVKN